MDNPTTIVLPGYFLSPKTFYLFLKEEEYSPYLSHQQIENLHSYLYAELDSRKYAALHLAENLSIDPYIAYEQKVGVYISPGFIPELHIPVMIPMAILEGDESYEFPKENDPTMTKLIDLLISLEYKFFVYERMLIQVRKILLDRSWTTIGVHKIERTISDFLPILACWYSARFMHGYSKPTEIIFWQVVQSIQASILERTSLTIETWQDESRLVLKY